MKNFIASLVFALVIAIGCSGQQCPAGSSPYQNDSSTGTTLNTLTKINSSGAAVIMATSDTSGYKGVAVSGAGTVGTVCLATAGLAALKMDATSTVQHYILISATTGGDGHDTGSSSTPVSGGDLIGTIVQASTGSGALSLVSLFPPEILATNPTGAVTGPGSSTNNDCVTFNGTGGNQIQDPGTCQVTNGTIHAANTVYSTSFSTASISPATVSGLTSPQINANANVAFHCAGYWSSTSTAIGSAFQILASQTPQSIWYTVQNINNPSNTSTRTSVANGSLLTGGNAATTGTNYGWTIDGQIQWNASTPGTWSVQAAVSTASGTVTIGTNSFCSILP